MIRLSHIPLKWLQLSILVTLLVNGALILTLQAGGLGEMLAKEADELSWLGVPYAKDTGTYDLFGWNLPTPEQMESGDFGGSWLLPYRLDVPKVLYTSDEILADSEGRISEGFLIADNMKDRVGFWFDIYTKYDFEHRVIHHSRYPWLVFEVVDITPEMEGKGARWYRIQKGEKRSAARLAEIRRALRNLPHKKKSRWTQQEKTWAASLNKLPGRSFARKASFAASSLRTQTGQKTQFREALIRGEEYFPAMAEIFETYNLPIELTRLPLVESSFNLHATSKVGASGVWQIMPQIGGRLMKVTSTIDERLSPLKSTHLAARLFKENYQILYKRWPLAVTAYNHGPGGVRKASRAAGSRDLGQIIARYQSKRFSFATSNFYACFQAALHAEVYKDHLFPGMILKEPLSLKEIKLTKRTRPSHFRVQHQVSKDELHRLNPDLKKLIDSNGWLPTGLKVYIPAPLPIAQNDASSTGS